MPKSGWGRVISVRSPMPSEYALPACLTWPDTFRARAARGGFGFLRLVRFTGDGFGVSGVSHRPTAVISPVASVLQVREEVQAGAR